MGVDFILIVANVCYGRCNVVHSVRSGDLLGGRRYDAYLGDAASHAPLDDRAHIYTHMHGRGNGCVTGGGEVGGKKVVARLGSPCCL